jgi:hypothetical protein
LSKYLKDDADRSLAALVPQDAAGLAEFQKTLAGACDVIIGRKLPQMRELSYEQLQKDKKETWIQMSGLLRTTSRGEEFPIVFCFPNNWNKRVVMWVHGEGKQGLFQPDGQPREEVQKLMAAGTTVVGLDLLYQGEFLAEGKPLETTRRVPNKREFAGYTFGYNHTVFAQRVHDLLSAIVFVKNHEQQPEKIELWGMGDVAGPLVAAARVQAGDVVDRIVIDTAGFRFSKLTNVHDPRFVPGGAKYYDLSGFLAAAAPRKVWITGETPESLAVVQAAYKAAGAAGNLVIDASPAEKRASAAFDAVLKP